MRARHGWYLFVGFVVVALLIGSGIAQAQERRQVAKLADILSPDHPNNRTWVHFAERVKERTGGRLEIQVFHSGQLGQQKDLFLGMQAGNIQMAKMPFTYARTSASPSGRRRFGHQIRWYLQSYFA